MTTTNVSAFNKNRFEGSSLQPTVHKNFCKLLTFLRTQKTATTKSIFQ